MPLPACHCESLSLWLSIIAGVQWIWSTTCIVLHYFLHLRRICWDSTVFKVEYDDNITVERLLTSIGHSALSLSCLSLWTDHFFFLSTGCVPVGNFVICVTWHEYFLAVYLCVLQHRSMHQYNVGPHLGHWCVAENRRTRMNHILPLHNDSCLLTFRMLSSGIENDYDNTCVI